MESPSPLHCERPAGVAPLCADVREPAVALCRAGELVWASDGFAELLGAGPADMLRGRSLPKLLAELGVEVPKPGAQWSKAVRIAGQGSQGSKRGSSRSEEPEKLGTGATRDRMLSVHRFDLPATSDVPTEELWTLSDATPDRDRSELIALLSHELRTPLTVISGYGNLLLSERAGKLSDEQRRYLEESRNSCQRLNNFVLDLLDASHDPSHAISLNLVDLPVVPAIRAVVEFFLPLLEEKNLVVEIDAPSELCPGRFDPLRIEQVLTNLLGNAVKYTKAGSEISVSVREVERQKRQMIEVAMIDNGPGIAVVDSKRIFEPFVRTTGDRHAPGVGLGLSICRRILEAHGGEIWVDAAAGRGSRFAFVIPAVASVSLVEC